MPTYEYVCKSGHVVEVSHSIKKEPLTECLAKGVDHRGNVVTCCSPCKRQIAGGTSFILKGTGWTPKGNS